MVKAEECSRCHRLFSVKNDHSTIYIDGKPEAHYCDKCTHRLFYLAKIGMYIEEINKEEK